MEIRTSVWYETKIKYEKTMEDGKQKKVTEVYVVDAHSFTESEEAITNELKEYISGEFKVVGIKKVAYTEIVFDEDNNDKHYLVKVQYVTLDESSGKEKLTTVPYLIQGKTLQGAIKTAEEFMTGTMSDWQIASIAVTNILDVFVHQDRQQKK